MTMQLPPYMPEKPCLSYLPIYSSCIPSQLCLSTLWYSASLPPPMYFQLISCSIWNQHSSFEQESPIHMSNYKFMYTFYCKRLQVCSIVLNTPSAHHCWGCISSTFTLKQIMEKQTWANSPLYENTAKLLYTNCSQLFPVWLARATLHIKPGTYLTSSDKTSSNFGFFPKMTFSVLSISTSLLGFTIAGTEGFSSNRFLKHKTVGNLHFASFIYAVSGDKRDMLRATVIPFHLGNNPGNSTHKNCRGISNQRPDKMAIRSPYFPTGHSARAGYSFRAIDPGKVGHRITEWVRLQATTVGYLVQPPWSSKTILEHMAQERVQMILI